MIKKKLNIFVGSIKKTTNFVASYAGLQPFEYKFIKMGQPKYLEISKVIISKIESSELMPGDKAPSENELIKSYRISNTTARKSLLEVENRGWVRRIKGKGTFVLNRTEDMHLTRILGSFDAMRESFDENLKKEGFTPRNIILEKTILENGISTNVNDKTYRIEGPVLKIHRLRYANDTLMKDEIRYVSMNICKKMHLIEFDRSFIKIYEDKYHLKLEEIQRTLNNVVLYPDDANNYFENDIPMATFILNGVIIINDKRVVEIERSYYRGDKYRFSTKIKPRLISGAMKPG